MGVLEQIYQQNACLLHVYTELCDFQMLHYILGLDKLAGRLQALVCAQVRHQGSCNVLSKIDLEIHTGDYDDLEIGYRKNDGFVLTDMEFGLMKKVVQYDSLMTYSYSFLDMVVEV